MFLLAGTANVFAGTNAKAAEAKKLVKTETVKVSETKAAKDYQNQSCTITLKSSSRNVTVTASCDCTEKQACDAAYKVATLLMK